MASDSTTPFHPSLLRTGPDLRRLAIEPTREDWHCVRRGVWIRREVWSDLSFEDRHLAFIVATVISARSPEGFVLAGHSAAAMLGLPRIEAWPDHILVLDAERVMGPSRFVRPRQGAPVEPVSVGGLLVTPPARTVVDLACTGSLDTALAAADRALSLRLCTREQLAAEAELLPRGARGRGTARLVADLADGLSGSAGESLSRLQMFRANFPRPVLQREYRDDRGRIGIVDFDHDELIGEFDGRLKYRVPPGASAEEAGEIVWREKQREDRLRRHKSVARWVWKTARDTAALARLLMSHGLRPEPRSTWIDLGRRREPPASAR